MFVSRYFQRVGKIKSIYNYNKQYFGTIDHENMSAMDIEKELFKMKREMGVHYSNGSYNQALLIAQDMERNIIAIMGSGNAVHASCLNNIGLMQKNLGQNESALKSYNAALEIYEKAESKEHPSYLSTLSNIGALYKNMSESTDDVDKAKSCLEKAETSLTFVINKRHEHQGKTNYQKLIYSLCDMNYECICVKA
jgi:tetratricopeptide (TPR) repeat protein